MSISTTVPVQKHTYKHIKAHEAQPRQTWPIPTAHTQRQIKSFLSEATHRRLLSSQSKSQHAHRPVLVIYPATPQSQTEKPEAQRTRQSNRTFGFAMPRRGHWKPPQKSALQRCQITNLENEAASAVAAIALFLRLRIMEPAV